MDIDETTLTKGQLRKLNGLRRSIGTKLGEKAFAEWYEEQPAPDAHLRDLDAEAIEELISDAVLSGEISIPKSGFIIRRGRRRVLVYKLTPADADRFVMTRPVNKIDEWRAENKKKE